MIHRTFNSPNTFSAGQLLPLLLAMGLMASGCDQLNELTGQGKSETSADDTTAEAKADGPCGEYANALCTETGEKSPSCEAVRKATELMPPAACRAGLKDLGFSKAKLAEAGKKCDELIKKLCDDVGPTTSTCELVKTQTKQFPPDRCEMMLGHYDEVLADLKKMEARNQPLSEEQQALINAPGAPSFGPADAKVTIVEFSDFECPYCSKAADVVGKIKEKYGDQVRFVFRQFPLSFHKNAHAAAQASLAANAQGKFWDFHDKLFTQQKQLDRASLEGAAKDLGLDVKSFGQAMDDKAHAAQVDADLELGKQVGVDGTPSMFLNGKRVPNPTDFEMVSNLIEEALKNT